MKLKLLPALLLVALTSCHSNGQPKSKPKANNSTSSGGASEITLTIPEKTYPSLKPGDMAPDVVKIDADELTTPIDGTCIIKKGTLEALIDLRGNYIIPYGQYELIGSAPFSTLITVRTATGCGYKNLKGETVIPSKYTEAGQFDAHKIALVNIRMEHYLIDTKGNILSKDLHGFTSVPYERELFDQPQSELIKFFRGNAWGYMNKAGQVIIGPQFKDATEFTDGMAAVSQTDQFGAKKWGFIDVTGKLVIPYNFTIRPGQFHEGLALVQPAQRGDFNFAYIDKTGAVKFKVGNGDQFSPYFPCGEMHHASNAQTGACFFHGYAIWAYGDQDYRFCDKSGTMHKLAELVKDTELANDPKGLLLDNFDDRLLYFQKGSLWQMTDAHGAMDYQGNVVYPASFLSLNADYFSPYAFAKFIQPTIGPNNTQIITQGIINRQGVFVLVLNPKSTF